MVRAYREVNGEDIGMGLPLRINRGSMIWSIACPRNGVYLLARSEIKTMSSVKGLNDTLERRWFREVCEKNKGFRYVLRTPSLKT